jgi:hypothetical protein
MPVHRVIASLRRVSLVATTAALFLVVLAAASPQAASASTTTAANACTSSTEGFCGFDLYVNGASSSPPGWGTVTISPTPTSNEGGQTTSTCSDLYETPCYVGDWTSPLTVTLTAQATSGSPNVSYFDGWSGACAGSALTCTFTLPYESQATCTGGDPSDPPGAWTAVCANFSGSPPKCGNPVSQNSLASIHDNVSSSVKGATSCSPKTTSGTWSGYYSYSTKAFTYITTTFVQPKMTCPAAASEPAETNIWAGFDGASWIKSASGNTVEQAGTEALCTAAGADPVYSAWYEMFGTSVNNGNQVYFDGKTGAGHAKPQIVVKPDDQITVTLSFDKTTGKYTLTVSDGGPHGSAGPTVTGTATVSCGGATCKRGSAEWVVERRSNGPGGLAKWEKLEMQNDLASTTVPATPSSISSFTHYGPITMIANNDATVMAKPASLTDGGQAFAVTFKDPGP